MNAPKQATLDDVLAAVRALDAKLDALFKHGASGSALATSGAEVTLAELVPLMPKGLRSRSSVQRLLAARAITGRKVLGSWSFKPAKVMADLDRYERLSAAASFDRRNPTARRRV